MRTSIPLRIPYDLGPMPLGRAMRTVNERVVRAPLATIFTVARDVEHWPAHLGHYRYVRFREHATDGGGLVEMSAVRPFGPLPWPTWWLSQMSVIGDPTKVARGITPDPAIRFRHVGGITRGMDVEWSFLAAPGGTQVRIVHEWDGPHWPAIGIFAATNVIGPVFIHDIAGRTLEGLAVVAERTG